MKQFTYLLGAGASAKSIPIVSGFTKGLIQCHDNYESKNLNGVSSSMQTIANFKSLLGDIKWLYEKSSNFYSIDTLAKQLYLTNNIKDLKKLKIALSSYLTLTQGERLHDLRYDLFFATLLSTDGNSLNKLPSNIKMLSWNYDYQVELSISQFLSNYQYTHEIESFINSYPCKHQLPYRNFAEMNSFIVSKQPAINCEGFGLFKLNGTAGGFIHDQTFIERDIAKYYSEIEYTQMLSNLLDRVTNNYDTYRSGSEPSIHFAWEDDYISKCTRTIAKESTKNTDILIVIGYSFPTFNREIDRDIINNMTNLKKIYFQTPKDNVDGVIQRFKAIKNDSSIEIEPITNCDEFFIPYEL